MKDKKHKKKEKGLQDSALVPACVVRRTTGHDESGNKNLKAFFVCDKNGVALESHQYATAEEAKQALTELTSK